MRAWHKSHLFYKCNRNHALHANDERIKSLSTKGRTTDFLTNSKLLNASKYRNPTEIRYCQSNVEH